MKIDDLLQMVQRAGKGLFSIENWLLPFLAFVLSGLIFIAFHGMGRFVNPWGHLFILGFPFFLLIFLLMPVGILQMKTFVLEREGKTHSLKETFDSSKKTTAKGLLYGLAPLALFIFFWLVIGVFVLLKTIPYIGPFLGVILAFIPFLLNLSILLLVVVALGMLFFFAPLLALHDKIDSKTWRERLNAHFFIHLLLFAVAVIPVWLLWLFLLKGANLTFFDYSFGDSPVEIALQSLFMLLPAAALLSFAANFFFNFSLEAYRYLQKDS